jgi:hypothetical protein
VRFDLEEFDEDFSVFAWNIIDVDWEKFIAVDKETMLLEAFHFFIHESHQEDLLEQYVEFLNGPLG